MLGAINHTFSTLQTLARQQDEALSPRKKRSIEPIQAQASAIEFGGPAANDRRNNTGGIDSLGRGNLL